MAPGLSGQCFTTALQPPTSQHCTGGTEYVYVAVIVSSIPAYMVVLYFFYICGYTDCKNCFCTRGVLRCLLGVEMVAGVIEFVGGILFIAAGATLNDPIFIHSNRSVLCVCVCVHVCIYTVIYLYCNSSECV